LQFRLVDRIDASPICWGQRRDHSPRLDMTRETSSTLSSPYSLAERLGTCIELFQIVGAEVIGGPYTLGKEGAVAEGGLELPSSAMDVVGESGTRGELSVIRERE